jgi:hypothetical protein
VEKATSATIMLVHIFVEYGVYLPDLKKDTLERRLEDPEIPDALKQLLRVRLATTTTSTAKYQPSSAPPCREPRAGAARHHRLLRRAAHRPLGGRSSSPRTCPGPT